MGVYNLIQGALDSSFALRFADNPIRRAKGATLPSHNQV
jgi:hypothetical protein